MSSTRPDKHDKFGLKDKKGVVASLVSSSISSSVFDFVSTTSITLRFLSDSEDEMLEVVYSQPIDPNATIYSMEVVIEGRTIKSELREKTEARKLYSDSVDTGHGAFLGENDSNQSDIYCLSIGNILPKTEVLINFSYLSELVLEDNSESNKSTLRASYPVGMFRRYSPAGRSLADKDRSGTSGTGVNDIPIDIEVNIEMPCDISSISSQSDAPLRVNFGRDSHQTANVKSIISPSTGDFILIIGRVEGYRSCLWVPFLVDPTAEVGTIAASTGPGLSQDCSDWIEVSPDENNNESVPIKTVPCMLSLFPNTSGHYSNDQLSEIVFIVDRSGSMSGSYIKAAAETLSVSIASLPLGCQFQVIGFGSIYESLFNYAQFVSLDDSTKMAAMTHAQTLAANLGGTEILKPFECIASYPNNELPRNILIITDGGVSNTSEVVRFARENYVSTGTRYFTFGIGNGASRGLLEGVAGEGGGGCEMIDDSDVQTGALQVKVLRQLSRVLYPSLCSIQLQWGLTGTDASVSIRPLTQSPERIPSILKNTKQLVYMEIKDSDMASVITKSPAVVLVGSTPDGQYKESVTKVLHMSRDILEKCLARSKLRDLEAKHSELVSKGDVKASEACKACAVALSISSGILCRYTSQIAIETRRGASDLEGNADGDPRKRRTIQVFSCRDPDSYGSGCGGGGGGGGDFSL